jgi:hypothetical protein
VGQVTGERERVRCSVLTVSVDPLRVKDSLNLLEKRGIHAAAGLFAAGNKV